MGFELANLVGTAAGIGSNFLLPGSGAAVGSFVSSGVGALTNKKDKSAPAPEPVTNWKPNPLPSDSQIRSIANRVVPQVFREKYGFTPTGSFLSNEITSFIRNFKSNDVYNGGEQGAIHQIGSWWDVPEHWENAGLPVPAALGGGASGGGGFKDTLLTVVNGAKEGALNAFLDNTEPGKAAKNEAIQAQTNKYLPILLAAGGGFLAYKMLNK